MANLKDLKSLTQELQILSLTADLAIELEAKENGKWWSFIKLLFDQIQSDIVILAPDMRVRYANPYAKEQAAKWGVELKEGTLCWENFWGLKEACKECAAKKAMESKRISDGKIVSPRTGREYEVTCIPIAYNGVSGVIIFYKRHEEKEQKNA